MLKEIIKKMNKEKEMSLKKAYYRNPTYLKNKRIGLVKNEDSDIFHLFLLKYDEVNKLCYDPQIGDKSLCGNFIISSSVESSYLENNLVEEIRVELANIHNIEFDICANCIKELYAKENDIF